MLKRLCPISKKHINENVTRINAVLLLLIMVAYFFSDSIYIILFLLLDFFVKGFIKSKYSLTFQIAFLIWRVCKLPVKYSNEGPKIFSSRFGFLFSFLIILFSFLSMEMTSLIIASILCSFMFLEAVFGFCVACHFYPYFLRYIYDF